MKQMSNSSHLKHFVSSPKIWAPHPGAVPCWGCPWELRGPWGCGSGGIPGFKAPQQSQQACFRGGWNKGVWNSQFVNLMDPLRLLTAIGVKKDGERWGEKKKRQCIPCLMLLSQGQRGLGTPGTEQRVTADISVLRWRVPLAEWATEFWLFNPKLSQKVVRQMTTGPKPTAGPWRIISADYVDKIQNFFEVNARSCSCHTKTILENLVWCIPSTFLWHSCASPMK